MNATDLARALSERGKACAKKNGYPSAEQGSFVVGFVEAEFENALAILDATDTPEAKRYMAHLRQRFAANSLTN